MWDFKDVIDGRIDTPILSEPEPSSVSTSTEAYNESNNRNDDAVKEEESEVIPPQFAELPTKNGFWNPAMFGGEICVGKNIAMKITELIQKSK